VYAFAVRACSPQVCSPWSDAIQLANLAPKAPWVTARRADAESITIGWEPGAGEVDQWRIAVNRAGTWDQMVVAPGARESRVLVDPGLYDLFVRGCRLGACSEWSGARASNVIPAAPGGLTRSDAGDLVLLEWDSTDPRATAVQLAVDASNTVAPGVSTFHPGTTSALVDWEIASWVRACDAAGCSAWVARQGAPADRMPPSAPTPAPAWLVSTPASHPPF
jgi:hypothetical protein